MVAAPGPPTETATQNINANRVRRSVAGIASSFLQPLRKLADSTLELARMSRGQLIIHSGTQTPGVRNVITGGLAQREARAGLRGGPRGASGIARRSHVRRSTLGRCGAVIAHCRCDPESPQLPLACERSLRMLMTLSVPPLSATPG